MVFINCLKVRVFVKCLLFMIFDSNGLSDVCINVLLMLSNEKEINISKQLLLKIGSSNDVKVIIRLSNMVFLCLMWFISIFVGIEKIRNQKKMSDGKMFVCEFVSFKFVLMQLEVMFIRFMNFMVKKQSIIGMSFM